MSAFLRARLPLLSLCAAMASCDGQIMEPELTLTLSQVSSGLRLEPGSAVKGARPLYPNPTHLTKMEVRVSASGGLKTSCADRSGATDCVDAPFFPYSEPVAAGTRLRLFDLYGQLVLEETFELSCGGELPDPGCLQRPQASSGEECGELGCPGGAGGGSGSGGSACELGCGESGPPKTCEDLTARAKRRFCELVQRELDGKKVKYSFDCATLKDVPDPKVKKVVENPPLKTCKEITNPAAYQTRTELDPEAANLCEKSGAACPDRSPACLGTGRFSSLVNTWRENARSELASEGLCVSSPLVLDLAGDGIELSSIEDGVAFDILAAGEKASTSWMKDDDALLCLDRNGNGRIDGAAELFGEYSGGEQQADGFAALARHDENKDGRIDRKDSVFSSLLLWRDLVRDGDSAREELTALAQAGIASLELGAMRVDGARALDEHGNAITLRSRFVRKDGSFGQLVDAYFRFKPISPPAAVAQKALKPRVKGSAARR